MTTIHITKKVADRLKEDIKSVPTGEETILGFWCAHLFYSGHNQFLMVTNEKTLLTVVFPAKELKNINKIFPNTVDMVLQKYSIPNKLRENIFRQLSKIEYSRNTKKQVLGSMNDFIKLSKYYIDDVPDLSLKDLSLKLCDTPCSPIQMKSPKEAVLDILSCVMMIRKKNFASDPTQTQR
jgi:hypothetical protein